MSWSEIPCVGFELYLKAPPLSLCLSLVPYINNPILFFVSSQTKHFSATTSPTPTTTNLNMEITTTTAMFGFFACTIFVFVFHSLLKFFLAATTGGGRRLPLPPGSLGWPYIGETFQLYSQNPNVFFASKQKRYGSVFKTHILGCPCVMVSSPEATKMVLATKAPLFKPTFPASKERMLGKLAIFFHQGDYHTKLRKLVLRAFMPESIKSIVSDIESIATATLQSFEGRLMINTFQEMKTVS